MGLLSLTPLQKLLAFHLRVVLTTTLGCIHILLQIPALYRQWTSKCAPRRWSTARKPWPIQQENFAKLPKHLGVVLSPREPFNDGDINALLDTVANVAAWCVYHGVEKLTVFEKTGIASEHLSSLQLKIATNLVRQGSEKLFTVSDGNSHATCEDDFQIRLLSAADSRAAIVNLTQALATACRQGSLRPSEITTDFLDRRIKETVGEETDLLVVCSPSSLVLNGYPPWHLRLTEIFHVDTNSTLRYDQFVQALRSYAGVEMRFGR